MKSDLKQRFLTFHQNNPWVYQALEYLALAEARAGKTRLSIAKLYEQVRGSLHFTPVGPTPENPSDPPKKIKLPNEHRAYYSRELMKNNPELRGRFVIRPVPSDYTNHPPYLQQFLFPDGE